MNGVVYTASPAAQEHFPSGSFQMEIVSALRTRDVCFSHGAFCLITLPQPLPSREGRSTGDLPSREGRSTGDLPSREGKAWAISPQGRGGE
jgi:hypothetical protein